MTYVDTFITVAPDCPVDGAEPPTPWRGKPTVATVQHEMLTAAPYTLTQDDVLFLTHVRKRGIDLDTLPDGGEQLRAEFLATPRACLRASPLPKRHGYGVHFDGDGRAALHPLGSTTYAELAAGDPGGPTVLVAMRNARA